MAVSAFRSSTRRGGQFGSDEANTSNPRSRRDSLSGRSYHRRSNSITDFSPSYMSDCSSNYRSYSKSGVRRGGRSSVCPSDSENDMDCISMHGRHRYRNADSEDERPVNTQFFSSKINHQNGGLRRSGTGFDFTQSASHVRLNTSTPDDGLRGDDTQEFGEERTIGAVSTQMKSLRSAPPAGDSGSADFVDALRSEIRRAVGEIRIELEESKRKNCKSFESSDEGKPLEPHGTDVVQAVADIRKEYSTKFEQSEKRVRDLWAELAVEEQRCSELAKIVKELLPMPPSSIPLASTASDSTNRKRSHKRRNSAEKQIVSANLESEAQKYFDECVSISPLNYQGDSDGSFHEIVQHSESTKDRPKFCSVVETLSKDEKNATAKEITSVHKEEELSNSPIVGSDGVTLPWLQWEAEAVVNDSDVNKVGIRHPSNRSSSSKFDAGVSGTKNPFHSNSHTKAKLTKPSACDSTGEVMGHMKHSLSISKLNSTQGYAGLYKNSARISGPVRKDSKPSIPLTFTIDEKLIPKNYVYPDIDTQMLEKIRCRNRVERGELILCQSLLW